MKARRPAAGDCVGCRLCQDRRKALCRTTRGALTKVLGERSPGIREAMLSQVQDSMDCQGHLRLFKLTSPTRRARAAATLKCSTEEPRGLLQGSHRQFTGTNKTMLQTCYSLLLLSWYCWSFGRRARSRLEESFVSYTGCPLPDINERRTITACQGKTQQQAVIRASMCYCFLSNKATADLSKITSPTRQSLAFHSPSKSGQPSI